ncbi:MAG: hypothetical protein IPK74_09745 [Deltaproteobacteria bacterium]|nr:hypothetical protein [Deltaproteobacteria bacterium]
MLGDLGVGLGIERVDRIDREHASRFGIFEVGARQLGDEGETHRTRIEVLLDLCGIDHPQRTGGERDQGVFVGAGHRGRGISRSCSSRCVVAIAIVRDREHLTNDSPSFRHPTSPRTCAANASFAGIRVLDITTGSCNLGSVGTGDMPTLASDPFADEAFGQRLVRVGATVATCVWGSFAAATAIIHGHTLAVVIMASLTLANATLVLLHRRIGSGVGGPAFSLLLYLGVFGVGVARGGFEPAIAAWNLVLPLSSVLAGRPRRAWLFAAMAVLQLVALLFAERLHVLGPRLPNSIAGQLISIAGLLAVVVLMATMFHRARASAFRQYAALQRELFQAQQLDSLGRLAGGIAHDFNNLLSVIHARIDLATMAGVTERQRDEDLRAIREAARQGAALSRQLVAFAGRESGPPEPVEPGEVVAEIQRLLARVLPRGIRLETDVDPCTPTISVSPQHLHQILMNLCLNARDAMPEGGCIRVSTRALTLPGHRRARPRELYVRICVEDDGIGMSEDIRARVLEPFFTTKAKGTGLGLATVHRIVREYDGRLEVYSAPGHGSTFEVLLPAASDRNCATGRGLVVRSAET